MAKIDLHLHTTYSDGTLSPEEVVESAIEREVTLISITDHDEVGGVVRAQTTASGRGVTVISGVEINSDVGKEDVHILGYGFPADSSVLREGLRVQRDSRLERMHKMLGRLSSLGYPLSAERVLEIAGHGSVGRPHVARALAEAGFVSDYSEAFDKLIGNRRPAYVTRMSMPPEDAIELIHKAGGITSLAHPGKLGDPIRFIRRLKEAGCDALEAYHSDHTPAVTERMLRWARQYGLAVTGGSDSHGPGGVRSGLIGNLPIPDEVGELFLELLNTRGIQV